MSNMFIFSLLIDSWKTLLRDQGDIKTIADYAESICKRGVYSDKLENDSKALFVKNTDVVDKEEDEDKPTKSCDDKSEDVSGE